MVRQAGLYSRFHERRGILARRNAGCVVVFAGDTDSQLGGLAREPAPAAGLGREDADDALRGCRADGVLDDSSQLFVREGCGQADVDTVGQVHDDLIGALTFSIVYESLVNRVPDVLSKLRGVPFAAQPFLLALIAVDVH